MALSSFVRGSFLALTLLLPAPHAVAQKEAVQDTFHRAYYLEHEGDAAVALRLYEQVAADQGAPAALREEARRRVSALAEDARAADLAGLLPPETLLFVELNRPGEKLSLLLEQLGLLGKTGENGRPFGISPLLVQGLLGLRGAAVAVTSFDPSRGQPSGVAVLHPGDLDVVRGLIETMVPAGGQAVEPIEGHATWSIQGQAFATLTSRLVIISQSRDEIRGVLSRLSGADRSSLASSPMLQGALPQRDGLLSFCLNAEPLLPLVKGLAAQAAQSDPQAAMALDLLDIDSLRSLSGNLVVGSDGLAIEVALRLAEGHRNLAFNLLRMPHVNRETLQLVPQGAAFFFAAALNPSGPGAPIQTDSRGQPVVTMMDFGREFFGNLADVAIYGLPEESGSGIPDVAAVLRVNDAVRSRAVWGFALGLASQATGGMGPEKVRVAGAEALEYEIQGFPVYLATAGDRLVVSPSEAAVARSLQASSAGASVLEDPAFAPCLTELGLDETWILLANAGRALRFASSLMPHGQAAELAPFAELLQDTVVALGVEHSETRYALQARVRGIPDVSGLVAAKLGQTGVIASPVRLPAVASAVPPPRPQLIGQSPGSAEEQLARLQAAAADPARTEEARILGRQFLESCDDARILNNIAWGLLTEEPFGGRFDLLALEISRRANELTDYGNWYYVDTLARAVYENGDLEKAIELERIAVELAAGDPRGESAQAELERYLEEQRRRSLAGGG